MKKVHAFFILGLMLAGCRVKDKVLPLDVWSQDCVELAPHENGYRLSGMCCSHLTLPQLNVNKKGIFITDGVYSSFTGAGFADTTLRVTGHMSEADSVLTIAYALDTLSIQKFRLKPGPRKKVCECFCD
ncbi:hypothetical protein [Dyadobacter bucti]|uniref:hypothetical protein n=1 Tax=Dyadobacter bucti TaxID=2572203 RepID=UPI003F70062B